jgi:hypothetical protein
MYESRIAPLGIIRLLVRAIGNRSWDVPPPAFATHEIHMSGLNRRRFLKAAADSAFPLFTVARTKASGGVHGANDRISFQRSAKLLGSVGVAFFEASEEFEAGFYFMPDTNGTVDGMKGLQGVGGPGVAPWET